MQHFSREKKSLKIANLIFFILMIVANGLANTSFFGGQDTGAVSDKYYNLFTPASVTFAVWGVIYLALGYFVFFQLGKNGYGAKKDAIERIGPWFIVTCVLNASWLVVWGYELMPLAMLIIFLLLIVLYMIYFRLESLKAYLYNDERKAILIPFSLYVSWVSVASIANFAALVKYMNWSMFGIPEWIWIVFSIVVAALLNIYFIYFRHNKAFGLVGIWALFGIAYGRFQDGNIMPVGYTAAAACVILILFLLNNIFVQRKNH